MLFIWFICFVARAYEYKTHVTIENTDRERERDDYFFVLFVQKLCRPLQFSFSSSSIFIFFVCFVSFFCFCFVFFSCVCFHLFSCSYSCFPPFFSLLLVCLCLSNRIAFCSWYTVYMELTSWEIDEFLGCFVSFRSISWVMRLYILFVCKCKLTKWNRFWTPNRCKNIRCIQESQYSSRRLVFLAIGWVTYMSFIDHDVSLLLFMHQNAH